MSEKIYSEIPMRTWRWLGVNEAKVGEALLMDTEEKIITVPEGSKNSLVVVYRKESHGQLRIRLEEGAELSLTRVQLLPGDAAHAGNVEAVVAAGAKLHYTAVEAGAAASACRARCACSSRSICRATSPLRMWLRSISAMGRVRSI